MQGIGIAFLFLTDPYSFFIKYCFDQTDISFSLFFTPEHIISSVKPRT